RRLDFFFAFAFAFGRERDLDFDDFAARLAFARAFGLAAAFFAFPAFFAADFFRDFGFGLDVAAACDVPWCNAKRAPCGSARMAMMPPGMSIGPRPKIPPARVAASTVFFTSRT